MSGSSNRLEIRCNPANPVLYLACCGLFDLLARIDPEARGHWRAAAPSAFLLDTAIAESVFLAMVVDTFCEPSRWKYEPPNAGTEPTIIRATFAFVGHPNFDVLSDWWFETTLISGNAEDKSAWMMFTGQQTAWGVTAKMVNACARIKKAEQSPTDFTTLLSRNVEMSGRFGFDPRSSRGPLDVGYSFNDLKLPADTSPFAELLAMFGLSSFFPCRLGGSGKYSTTRGWVDRNKEIRRGAGFLYRLWPRALPIALARYAAVQNQQSSLKLFSVRADDRGYYHNLTLAKTAPANLK